MPKITIDNIQSVPQFNTLVRTKLQDFLNKLSGIAAGHYDGTGAVQHVTLGIMPDIVIVFREDTNVPVIWTRKMTGTNSKSFSGALLTDAITGLSPNKDGFSVGVNALVNTLGNAYIYIAIGL